MNSAILYISVGVNVLAGDMSVIKQLTAGVCSCLSECSPTTKHVND